jgi:S1/P1 Nuclease
MKRICPALGLALLSLSGTAAAWNSAGHMMIAAVAYEKLTPAAHARVTRLLQLNPDYPRWIAHASREERDEVAFVMAATWPDEIKSEPDYQNDGDRPAGAEAARNIGYQDHLQHRYWHFIDLPFSTDHTPLRQPPVPNAETQIALFRKTLASTDASDALKSYDMVWLLHLVGDVHQPLHTTSRFDRSQPNGDAGGNLVALCRRPCRNELHAFWDDVPGTEKNPVVAIRRAAHLPQPDAHVAAIDDERQWIHESFLIAQNSVYIPPIGDGPGPWRIDGPYRSIAHRVTGDRLALAGYRLAHVLNEAFR